MKKIILLLFVISLCASNLFSQAAKAGAQPSWTKGKQDAKANLEVFNDYQCPVCTIFNRKLKILAAKFPDNLQITFRHFPLTYHDKAILAARAVEAAGIQGKFWEMSDLILERQQKWTAKESAEKAFVYYAKRLGLNVEMFKADLGSQPVADRIGADVERGKYLELDGTPTVLLNGKKLGFEQLDELEKLIKEN